jgi:hypothetical protein
VDVLRFILKRREAVNEVRGLLEQTSIPDNLVNLYWILLPSKLFSLTLEIRGRKLGEVLPIVRETVHKFHMIKSRIKEGEDMETVDLITAHFLAWLRANAFDGIVTAWILSQPRRDWLRSEETRFLTRFHPQVRYQNRD